MLVQVFAERLGLAARRDCWFGTVAREGDTAVCDGELVVGTPVWCVQGEADRAFAGEGRDGEVGVYHRPAEVAALDFEALVGVEEALDRPLQGQWHEVGTSVGFGGDDEPLEDACPWAPSLCAGVLGGRPVPPTSTPPTSKPLCDLTGRAVGASVGWNPDLGCLSKRVKPRWPSSRCSGRCTPTP